jgi:succinate-acetate transporter protein
MAGGTAKGNPAVVGLAGFGMTTLVLQFHNLGWINAGVVFCLAIFVGGGMQLLAGLEEFGTGNNFGFSAFSMYGAFWLALGAIFLMLELEKHGIQLAVLKITGADVGWFMVGWAIYTGILWIGSLRIHLAMAVTFTTLLIGFIGLSVFFLGGESKAVMTFTAWDLIVCALAAWYMMAHVILLQVFEKNILPVGGPIISPSYNVAAQRS